ncbi:MAG: ABC transporter ATP-binding protein [Alphaproteobacteria bacterium]|nr:ABC transporter ATP-binding protein [Alphaproteobacteria bacterium]
MSDKILDVNPLDSNVLLKVVSLGKTFIQGGKKLTIFKNLDLKLEAGELVALVGPSGSGKSTLLQLIGLLDKPTSGHIYINGKPAHKISDGARTKIRRDYIGFVYQFHHLLPEFTALENVSMPQIIAGINKAEAEDKAAKILGNLGLKDRLSHRPGMLSGGEQQRVAIARALGNNPKLLFADEPTGNLDSGTASEVFEILLNQVRERGIGALVATHNLQLADQMDRVLELKAGKIIPY